MSDQENSFASNAVPEVQNRASKPPGILPKNAQTWAILGLSALMVLVITFSNSSNPKPKAKGSKGQTESTTPTQARIDEYKAMVDEEARRLAAERQRAEQTRLQAQSAVNAMQRQAMPPASMLYPGEPAPYPPAGYSAGQRPEESREARLEVEKKKREYSSLFSSNVALSYRERAAGPAPEAKVAKDADIAALRNLQRMEDDLIALREYAGAPRSRKQNVQGQQPPESTESDEAEAQAKENFGRDAKRESADRKELQVAEGPQYRLFEGTVIETVLTNRLDGNFSGPVNAMVTTAVYSHDHQTLLIPQGTRILGEVQKVTTFGQQRLAVFFHRLIMPDGYSVSLDRFQGLNQIGETGLKDHVNRHYMRIFGISLAIGAIAGVAQGNSRFGYDMTGIDAYRQGVATSLSQSSLRILDRYLNVLPTFTIREGHRIKVYLSDDLLLPAYEQHRLPNSL